MYWAEHGKQRQEQESQGRRRVRHYRRCGVYLYGAIMRVYTRERAKIEESESRFVLGSSPDD